MLSLPLPARRLINTKADSAQPRDWALALFIFVLFVYLYFALFSFAVLYFVLCLFEGGHCHSAEKMYLLHVFVLYYLYFCNVLHKWSWK